MSRYRIIPQNIPPQMREEINRKILLCVNAGKDIIPGESIYNCYTGDGGIHGLKPEDFPSFHEYTKAKQEIENGQFFTPHQICRMMVDILSPQAQEKVVDICCGMGNMFNFLPDISNAYGCDIDAKAVTVAKHLYPDANIQRCSMQQYEPQMLFDCSIGNPPFNIRTEEGLSQEEYMNVNARLLAPAGILLAIVPESFLKDAFWEGRRINAIDRNYSFIGQCPLDTDTFKALGVKAYPTKIMAFMRRSYHFDHTPFDPSICMTADELKTAIRKVREEKQAKRFLLMREITHMESDELEAYEYKVRKYLWELKCHPHLKDHLQKAQELVSRFRAQRPPENCTDEEYKKWKQASLTPAKVLSTIRRIIRNQNHTTRKEIALVKTAYGYKYKQYAQSLLERNERCEVSINNLVFDSELPAISQYWPSLPAQTKAMQKVIARKKNEYNVQSADFKDMSQDTALAAYLDSASFVNKNGETCQFTELQKADLNLVMQKRYALLNWQQGSGKTAAAYHWSKRILDSGKVKNVVILAPAIAVNMTWVPFLAMNGCQAVVLKTLSDIETIPDGVTVVLSTSMISKLKKGLIRFMKTKSRKICLVFDESDEITNSTSQRTRNILDVFRRAKYKLLATGTTTRNNIAELYSQMELLYNNSINMINRCSLEYHQNKDGDMESISCDGYGKPFPARGGHIMFRSCHCPGKATVFGIEKQNQDIYNKDELLQLIDKTIITRKFKDFAGEKYDIIPHVVTPSAAETAVYRKIIAEFHNIYEQFYRNTGDARKEAALRLMRQIKLLIKSCSVPNRMPGYDSESLPTKTKKITSIIGNTPGKIAIGCTTIESMHMYADVIRNEFPYRPLYVIHGEIPAAIRLKMVEEFDRTANAVMVCTQQSLSSSANISRCDDVILESLQWNIPRMEQFYFRFIRLDSQNRKRVHMVTYESSIEQNLIALVLTKERLNDFIKTGEVTEESDIYEEFGVQASIIQTLISKTVDEKGMLTLSWGMQSAS